MNFNLSGLTTGLMTFEDRLDAAVHMFADTAAQKLQGDARDNAKWTDRTGDARRRLTATTEKVPDGYQIKLAHGVDYGMALELAHQMRYAIIEPTIRYTGTLEIMPAFEGLLNSLRM